MSILNYYYTGKVVEIRRKLMYLQKDVDGKIAIDCSPEALGLLDPAKAGILCNRKAYLDAKHTFGIVMECVKARRSLKEENTQENYERKFNRIADCYRTHELGYSLEFQLRAYNKVAEGKVIEEVAVFSGRTNDIELVFPKNNTGVIECNFYFKELRKRADFLKKTAEAMVASGEYTLFSAAYKALQKKQLDGILTELNLSD